MPAVSILAGVTYDRRGVTYFRDLSLYSYTRYARWALNVGWLDPIHAFDRELPSERVLDALWQFVKAPVVRTRGLHACEICLRDPDHDVVVRDLQQRMRLVPYDELPWPEDDRTRSVRAVRHGEDLLIGNAEIRVFGENGAIYAAPTLIYHYVLEHHYKPPGEFVRALLVSARPPGDEYRALLRRHEIDDEDVR